MWRFILIAGGATVYAIGYTTMREVLREIKNEDREYFRMKTKKVKYPLAGGVAAALFLISLYFAAVSFISGWDFALQQFNTYWYFIVSLAVSFGIQVGLYAFLKNLIASQNMKASGKVVATTGTTSTIAMISCCAHYLATALPILGISGFLSVVGQYQIELFWFGLASNLIGIGYLWRKISIVMKHV